MHIPDSFAERLEQEFRGRLRVRWSDARQEFHVEQKVGRGAFNPLPPRFRSQAEHRRRYDAHVRASDGYALVMVVRPGDRAGCDRCGQTLKVPTFASKEVKCACGASQVLAYFPLSDSLIDHLKGMDPERRGQEILREIRDLRDSRDLEGESLAREVSEGFRDTLIEQIPAARLSGRTAYWEE